MNELLPYIEQEPICSDKIWDKGELVCVCPYCGSADVDSKYYSKTLVGSSGYDINHFTHDCTCYSCKKKFIWEHKCNGEHTIEWYVEIHKDNGKQEYLVIKGIAGCCGSCYLYNCRCGGKIKIEKCDLYGQTTNLHIYKHGKKQYKEFGTCNKCILKVEIQSSDYRATRT